jgi:hypothetical protein
MLGYNLFLGTMSGFDRSKPHFNVFFFRARLTCEFRENPHLYPWETRTPDCGCGFSRVWVRVARRIP